MNSKALRPIRVFIASPSDVGEERIRASRVIEELNRGTGKALGFTLELVKWETHVTPQLGRPQQVILDQVDIKETDIFIGILWLRFGSKTGSEIQTEIRDYDSGTEEEFELAHKSWKQRGHPQVLFYQCTRPPSDLNAVDPEQLQKVRTFFTRFRPGGAHEGLVAAYRDVEDFERQLREHLASILRRHHSVPQERDAGLPPKFSSFGFTRLILANDMAERERVKRSSMASAHEIKLIAHSGHSFLAMVGHRYRDLIEERLNAGNVTFKALLANPYSVVGYLVALAEYRRMEDVSIETFYSDRQLWDADPVKVVEDTSWYKIKLHDALTGYRHLRDKFRDKIQVRLVSTEMPSTILITDSDCYLEPYLNVNLQERMQKDIITFEVQATAQSDLHRHIGDYFVLQWGHAITYEDFERQQDKLKGNFASLMAQIKQQANND